MFLGSAPSSLVLDAVERGHLPQWRTPRSAVGAPSCAALRFTRAHLGVGHVEPEDIKVFLGILVDLGRIGASAKRHGAATLPVADGCQERQPRTPHRKLQKTAARAARACVPGVCGGNLAGPDSADLGGGGLVLSGQSGDLGVREGAVPHDLAADGTRISSTRGRRQHQRAAGAPQPGTSKALYVMPFFRQYAMVASSCFFIDWVAEGTTMPLVAARKVSGWPKRCKLAHVFP